jgi:hypothetical protein
LIVLSPALGHAQPDERSVLAESLFREGRRLMDAGQVPAGCRKLEESQRLEAAAGTMLALAVCHEQEGRLATAWAEFSQSLVAARHDHRPDREAIANDHLTRLDGQLPRVAIDVPAGARVQGLEVFRNATQLADGAWGVALPCDPGLLILEVRAPGYLPWSTRQTLAPGATVRIEIPTLTKMASPAEVSPAAKADVESAGGGAFDVKPVPDKQQSATRNPRRWALPVALISLAPVAVGAGFGIAAIVEQKHSDDHCPLTAGRRICSQEGISYNERARSYATVSTVTIGVGLVGLAISAGLFWLGRPEAAQSTSNAANPLQFQLAWDGERASAIVGGRY